MEIGLLIIIAVLIGALCFSIWLLYSLNEKMMIMSKSSNVYEYKEAQEPEEEEKEAEDDTQSLDEIDVSTFIDAVTK